MPLEFGGVFDTTFEDKGKKTVRIKTPKVDMGKRSASLQLCFRAAAPQNVKPGICFRATPQQENGVTNPSLAKTKALRNEREKMPKGMFLFFF